MDTVSSRCPSTASAGIGRQTQNMTGLAFQVR